MLDHRPCTRPRPLDQEEPGYEREQRHHIAVADTHQPAKLEKQRHRQKEREVEPRGPVRQVEIKEDPSRMRPAEVPEVYGNISKAEVELGWRPEIPLRDSLERIFKDFYEKEGG